ncbi:tight junction protein ZO-2-like isoform X3 [Artemia franciscana]|nr:hypothetical protein QYM36_003916 [Artemia franciscana]
MEQLDPKEFVSSLFSGSDIEESQLKTTPGGADTLQEVKRKLSSISLDGEIELKNKPEHPSSEQGQEKEEIPKTVSTPTSPTKKHGNTLIIEIAPEGKGQLCVPSDCGIRVHRSSTPAGAAAKSSPSCSRAVSVLPLNDLDPKRRKVKPIARAASFSFSTSFATLGRKLGVKNSNKKKSDFDQPPPVRKEPPSPSFSLLQSVTSVATLPRKKNKIRRPGPFSLSVPSPVIPHQPLYGNLPPQEYSRNYKVASRCSSAMAPYSRYEDDPSLLPLTSFDDSPTSTLNRLIAHSPSASPIPPRLVEMYDEPVDEDIGVAAERVTWEYHHVTLQRIPGYGFGIAVSGGRDNPHFTNGDPAIAISDVLKGGPAEGKLQINDRVLSANSVPLENVDYNTAVQVLRDSGGAVSLVVKRRVVVVSTNESSTMKVTLTKGKKKEDFGIVLGCRIYIKEITNKALMSPSDGGPAIQEGDLVLRINSQMTENLSLKEAKKLMEQSRDKLQLVIKRDKAEGPSGTLSIGTNGPAENGHDSMGSPYQHHYSTQNLYVQSPTRHSGTDIRVSMNGFRSLDDKSNLTRQTGRSRGPITDLGVGSLDAEEIPPRPPPPRGDDYYPSRTSRSYGDENHRPTDNTVIRFRKEGGSVGIRLTGGNETGVFVSAVQPGSAASIQGLQAGDKILKVNGTDVKGATREETVLMLMGLQDQVELLIQHRKEEYDQVLQSGKGDLFFVKTHFSYDGGLKGDMGFKKGEIFKIIDTLYNGVVGQWQVARIGGSGQEIQRGVIPNSITAEEIATAQFNAVKKEQTVSDSSNKGGFFRRRRTNGRRSKSLGKDHWDDVVFTESLSKFPAYERVTLKHPGFVRPVVLFGSIADIARNRLLSDYPDKFCSPQVDSGNGDENEENKTPKSGIVRLSAIRTIIDSGRHALLDITPSAVDKLNYAQFYPVVVYLKADSKFVVKELRSSLPKTAHRSTKKLLEQSQKLDRLWNHIFTTTVAVTSADTWYKRMRECIEREQNQAVWMSENKLDNCNLADDFLFPMNTRLSYASSPESDVDLSPEPRMPKVEPKKTRLMRSSSDPSIVSPEEVAPSFSPPSYPRASTKQPSSEGLDGRRMDRESKYGFIDSGHSSRPSSHHPNSRHSVGSNHRQPFVKETGLPMDPPPPKIDRASKPRAYVDSGGCESGSARRGTSVDRDSRDKKTASYESTSSQEAYPRHSDLSGQTPNASSFRTREPTDPSRYSKEKSQDRGRSTARQPDPYRFSRSSTNPPPGSPSQERPLNGNYGTYDYKPSPPPKGASVGPVSSYKPVPPPKPRNYNRPPPLSISNGDPSATYWSHSSPSTSSNPKSPVPPRSYDNYYNSYNNYPKYEEDSNGFDSGHGSSLDRQSYGGLSVRPPSSNNKNQYYYNVPPRDNRPIDLQHRDQRGSAFELYRKPSYASTSAGPSAENAR